MLSDRILKLDPAADGREKNEGEINQLNYDKRMFTAPCQNEEAEPAFLRLLPAAVGAEPITYKQESKSNLAAIAILKRHPELLFVKEMVTDHFGRKIFASPYQLLLGTGDVWALKQVHEEIISKIADEKEQTHMQEQAEYQFKEQFPNCKLPFESELGEAALYDERNEAMIAQVIVQLEAIVEEITADPCTNGVATNDATTTAVATLRKIFAPKQGEVIKTGLHFQLAIMQEIFRVYDVQFAPWSGAQLSFFSREVIGAALAASTAVDGQCYKVGLPNLNVEKGPDRRDGLLCPHSKGIPQELTPLKGKLGYTMFVDPYNGYSCFQSSSIPGHFDWYNKYGWIDSDRCGLAAPEDLRHFALRQSRADFYKTYVEHKLHRFRVYKAAPRRENKTQANLLKHEIAKSGKASKNKIIFFQHNPLPVEGKRSFPRSKLSFLQYMTIPQIIQFLNSLPQVDKKLLFDACGDTWPAGYPDRNLELSTLTLGDIIKIDSWLNEISDHNKDYLHSCGGPA